MIRRSKPLARFVIEYGPIMLFGLAAFLIGLGLGLGLR